MKKTFLAPLLSLSIFFVMGTVSVHGFELVNPIACGSDCTLFTLLRMIIDKIILPIGGILAVLSFIYAGFLYVTAQGNESKLATAHKALLYTSVGTAVLLGSWVIAKVIENTINSLR